MAHEIVTMRERAERLELCSDFLETIANYYRVKADPEQLALDAEILQAYPIEHLRAAFRSHLADPEDCKFPPKPGDLIKRTPRETECLGGKFIPLTAEEKQAAIDAQGSHEGKQFQETLERVVKGMATETVDVEKRRAELKNQAGKLQHGSEPKVTG